MSMKYVKVTQSNNEINVEYFRAIYEVFDYNI